MDSGLLVSSVAAFRDYQQHKAWVWEHQALTRARFVAGDANIGKAFEQIRAEVLTQVRDSEKLKAEVLQMREKMRTAQHLKADMFDIKHSTGGIIDVEFIVQYCVLKHAREFPQVIENIGNIGLLNILGMLNIVDSILAKKVSDAYREYRNLQHALKLHGEAQLKVTPNSVNQFVKDVSALWQKVFSI
jgi:[glutamine synthetase] adenylyltransferase / [glutamine synthetase]-adenylyl-L-tyrosine phosphorylase